MKRSISSAFLLCLLILGSCSETPKKKEPQKPPEPVTGRFALFQMFNAGRGWAPDIQVLRLNSIHLPELKAEPGKAAAWEARFVSPGSSRARTYTYSAIEAPGNLHKGVFAGLEESWSGSRGSVTQPFLIAAVKTDSDEVYRTALKKAADYEKKNPGKTISFILEHNNRFPDPAWRVIWGESAGSSNFSIFVDASTGEYLATQR